MELLLSWLPKGQGSYTIMVATIAYAWIGVFIGHHTPDDAVKMTLAALGFGTFRRAVQ